MARFDWAGLERDLTDAVVRAVSAVVAEHSDERFYAAALWLLYRESDGPIHFPMLSVNSVEALAETDPDDREDLRWSPADWAYQDADWLPDDRWPRDLTAFACRGTGEQWDAAFSRFVTALVNVCKRARRELRGLPVVVLDPELHEELIPRILSAAEVRRHFPEFDEEARARADLSALSPADRAAFLIGRLGTFDGPITGEDAERALRDLGAAAVPGLVALLAVRDEAWQAAKLLADIGIADDAVVAGLAAAVRGHNGPDRSWAAAALSRLGHLDVVLAASPPVDDVVDAVAAPYKGFRDHAVAPPALDYAPLERIIDERPDVVAGLEKELAPGSSMCTITADEVDEALRGTGSRHALVRRHAVDVLGERRLGAAVGRRALPVLARLAVDDPDALVRRLAVVGLSFWGRRSRPYLDAGRAACDDPDPTVRVAATNWLRDVS